MFTVMRLGGYTVVRSYGYAVVQFGFCGVSPSHFLTFSPFPLPEKDFLAAAEGVETTVVKYVAAVAEGVFHTPVERVSRHGRPSALALDAVFRHRPRRIRAHNYQVGLVPFADKSALADIEQLRRTVAHKLRHTLNGEHATVYKLKHGYKRELEHRHT